MKINDALLQRITSDAAEKKNNAREKEERFVCFSCLGLT